VSARGLLRRLGRDERGVAFLEFAFIGPILLFVTLAGLELVNYALAYLRVNQIATTVADNAGRVTTGIDEANIYEVFAGADAIGDPMDFQANGRIVLSSLQDNGKTGGNAGQMINWQRCWGDLDADPAYGVEDDGRDDSSLEDGLGPAGEEIASVPGTAVMFVEVTYEYQSLISTTILPVGGRIRQESAFNVRGRQNNNISNAQGLAENGC
jgi:hypothetical protein